MEIATIERDELKAKLDSGADIRLVISLQRWAFEALHIPGSLHFDTPEELLAALDPEDEVIVYCSDPACVGSRFAYKKLVDTGYTNVRRYAGGLSDWEAAGYPLEGTAAG